MTQLLHRSEREARLLDLSTLGAEIVPAIVLSPVVLYVSVAGTVLALRWPGVRPELCAAVAVYVV